VLIYLLATSTLALYEEFNQASLGDVSRPVIPAASPSPPLSDH